MANVNDSRNLDGRVQEEYARLAAADLGDRDRELIEQFSAYRDGRVARNTLRQDMGNLRRAAEVNRKDSLLDLDSPSDVDRIISDMPRVSKPETKNTYNRSLRQLFKWAKNEGRGDFGWIEGIEDYKTDNGGTRRLKKEDYLTGEEVTKLLEAATHPREEALIEFLADTGARINVVTNLRVKDVELETDRPAFRPNPNAKDGYKGIDIKRYPIYYSERHLRKWVNNLHPDRPDGGSAHPDAPLFPKKVGYDRNDRQNGACHPNSIEDQLHRVAADTDIDKDRVHPHAFRHAAVRRMKTDPDFDFDWESVKLRTAWSDRAFEKMKELYGELEEEEQLDYFYRRTGKEIDGDDDPEVVRKECWSCGEVNRAAARFCDNCARALDPDAASARSDLQRGLGAVGALTDRSEEEIQAAAEDDELLDALIEARLASNESE